MTIHGASDAGEHFSARSEAVSEPCSGVNLPTVDHSTLHNERDPLEFADLL
jgi:hypothetical protein